MLPVTYWVWRIVQVPKAWSHCHKLMGPSCIWRYTIMFVLKGTCQETQFPSFFQWKLGQVIQSNQSNLVHKWHFLGQLFHIIMILVTLSFEFPWNGGSLINSACRFRCAPGFDTSSITLQRKDYEFILVASSQRNSEYAFPLS